MINKSFDWNQTKQLSLFQILLAFALPSGIAFIGFRVILPIIHSKGVPAIIAWPAIASLMLFLFVIFTFILLKNEAIELNYSLKERMCLKSLSNKEWGMYLIILLLGVIATMIFSKLSIYFTKIPLLNVPDYFPFFLNPLIDPITASPETLSPGYNIKGAFLIVPLIAITLILNILTEDLYFRAWLQPKMICYGEWSWVLNGFLFACYHSAQLWLFPQILPISFIMAYVVYKSKSILPSFLIHIVINTLTVIGLITLIFQ